MKQSNESKDYVHRELNQEVSSISGHYVLMEEIRLALHERKVLYLIGCAVVDNSCCGATSFEYAMVPGFILNWKYKKNEEGLPVSQVEPICDMATQNEIKNLIQEKKAVNQVNFM